MKLKMLWACKCNNTDVTAEYVLMECTIFDGERKELQYILMNKGSYGHARSKKFLKKGKSTWLKWRQVSNDTSANH